MRRSLKKIVKRKVSHLINKKVENFTDSVLKKDKEDLIREKKIKEMQFSEDQLKPAIRYLIDSGKSSEEIIGFLTSLLVCLTSAEFIKKKYD